VLLLQGAASLRCVSLAGGVIPAHPSVFVPDFGPKEGVQVLHLPYCPTQRLR